MSADHALIDAVALIARAAREDVAGLRELAEEVAAGGDAATTICQLAAIAVSLRCRLPVVMDGLAGLTVAAQLDLAAVQTTPQTTTDQQGESTT